MSFFFPISFPRQQDPFPLPKTYVTICHFVLFSCFVICLVPSHIVFYCLYCLCVCVCVSVCLSVICACVRACVVFCMLVSYLSICVCLYAISRLNGHVKVEALTILKRTFTTVLLIQLY